LTTVKAGSPPQTLDQIQDRLDELASEILETPQWRRNSPWHLDRASERQRLLAQRDQLRKRGY
jgi:hypothetical protein